MRVGTWRATVEDLSDPPPLRGATEHRLRVTFDRRPYPFEGHKAEWVPTEPFDEAGVRRFCAIAHPWVEEGQGDWASPRLRELRHVSAGLWEFVVRDAYVG